MTESWFQSTVDYVFGKVPTPEERIATTKKSLTALKEEYEDKCADIEYEQKQLEKKMNTAAQRQNEKELKKHAHRYVRYEREYAEYSRSAERTADFIIQVEKLKMDATFNEAFMTFSHLANMPLMSNTGQILQGVATIQKRKDARKLIQKDMDDALVLSSEEDEEDEEVNQRVAELVGEKLQQANATLIEKMPVLRPMPLSDTKNENPDLVARKVEQFLAKK